MKILNGIVGFIVGILTGLLLVIIEMKWMMRLNLETALPFVVGITVITCAVTGFIVGVKIGRRK